jgi:hypothetical protein
MGDSYADPDDTGVNPYGNDALTETNVVTLKQLREKYASVIGANSMQKVTEDMQILVRVTGNDIQGNIYQEIAVADSTGAFLIRIGQGGIFGYLPVGQQILVDLKDLYVGSYGLQSQIGLPYTSYKTGATSIGSISRAVWQKHFKIIGSPDASKVVPEEFKIGQYRDEDYITENCGKLMTIKGVMFKEADGKATFAPTVGTTTSVNRTLAGYNSSYLVVRTSTYADFANTVMPTGTVNLTGIFTRYRSTWQILLRSINDVEVK